MKKLFVLLLNLILVVHILEYKNKPKSPLASNWLLIGLVGVFLIAGIVTVWLTYSAVKDLVSSWDLSSPPGLTIDDSQAGAGVLPEESYNILQA